MQLKKKSLKIYHTKEPFQAIYFGWISLQGHDDWPTRSTAQAVWTETAKRITDDYY